MVASILVLIVILVVGVAAIGYITYRLTFELLTRTNRLIKRIFTRRRKEA